MKKTTILSLFVAIFCFAKAGVFDNKRITDNTTSRHYLTIPMPDNGYLFAARAGDSMQTVARVDEQGQVLWAKTLDNMSKYHLNDATISTDGSIYLIYNVGVTYTQSDFVVVKLDANGALLWTNGFDMNSPNGNYMDVMLKPQPDGGVFFTAVIAERYVGVRLSSTGAVASSMIIIPDSLFNGKTACFDGECTSDGGMILVGKNGSPQVVRINPNGSAAWTIYFDNGGYNEPRSIVATADGNYLVSGYYDQGHDYYDGAGWLMKISAGGSILWRKYYTAGVAGSWDFNFKQVIENSNGTITVVGKAESQLTPYEYHNISTLSAVGEPISGYIIPTIDYSSEQYYPRLFRAATGETKISGSEYTARNYTSRIFPFIMNTGQLSSFCNADTFPLAEVAAPVINDLVPGTFTTQTLIAPIHPDVTARDTSIAFTTQNFCASLTGVEEVRTTSGFSLHPNPVSSFGQVSLRWSAEELVKNIVVTDVNGRMVMQTGTGNENEISFSVSGLSPGLYFVQTMNSLGERTATKKLIVTQ